MTKKRTPSPPPKIRTEAVRLWRKVFEQWELDEDCRAMLTVAVTSYSRYLDALDILDREGLCVQFPNGLRKHPASEIAKNERQGFISAMAALGLKGEAEEKRRVGRPGIYS
jgi:P27 family predicted phage terminase small subunit